MDDSIIKVGSYSFSSVCCFSRLFYGCSSAAKPRLPAKSVAYLCRAQTEFHASEVIYGMPALRASAGGTPQSLFDKNQLSTKGRAICQEYARSTAFMRRIGSALAEVGYKSDRAWFDSVRKQNTGKNWTTNRIYRFEELEHALM